MVESPANFVGLGVSSSATKGGRLCTGTADEARNKFFPTAGCPAGREGVAASNLPSAKRRGRRGRRGRGGRCGRRGQRGQALRTVARVRDRGVGVVLLCRPLPAS